MPRAATANLLHVVINEHGPIFLELLDLLTFALHEIGVPCGRTRNQIVPGRCNVIVGHTMFLPERELKTIAEQARPYIVFQAEALDDIEGFSVKYPHYWTLLRHAAQIWDYSETNCRILAAKGFQNVHYIPLGYCPALQRIRPASTRDLDVIFFGSVTPRRRHVLEQMAAFKLRVEAYFGTYGEERDSRIARAKIVLNMHQFETAQLEQVRISYLLNNRCFVVSETSDIDPYGGGVVFCEYGRLAAICRDYAQPSCDHERDRIAAVGAQVLRETPMQERLRAAWAELT